LAPSSSSSQIVVNASISKINSAQKIFQHIDNQTPAVNHFDKNLTNDNLSYSNNQLFGYQNQSFTPSLLNQNQQHLQHQAPQQQNMLSSHQNQQYFQTQPLYQSQNNQHLHPQNFIVPTSATSQPVQSIQSNASSTFNNNINSCHKQQELNAPTYLISNSVIDDENTQDLE
jgi:hypothetical protein